VTILLANRLHNRLDNHSLRLLLNQLVFLVVNPLGNLPISRLYNRRHNHPRSRQVGPPDNLLNNLVFDPLILQLSDLLLFQQPDLLNNRFRNQVPNQPNNLPPNLLTNLLHNQLLNPPLIRVSHHPVNPLSFLPIVLLWYPPPNRVRNQPVFPQVVHRLFPRRNLAGHRHVHPVGVHPQNQVALLLISRAVFL
jgi:hypothetical protein